MRRFEALFLEISTEWSNTREVRLQNLLKFITTTNPNHPLVYQSIQSSWKNYQKLALDFQKRLDEEFPTSQLSPQQIQFLADYRKKIIEDLSKEKKFFTYHLHQRAVENWHPLRIPTRGEQYATGEILPENPSCYEVKW
ncbi:hypothetical protein OQJ18_03015 [Fluoribacter dumoffii]|uniref:Uncharacterized protein n=1 Tax=Fluoribacter dumoffii TaxID=463 RepID=A0A377GAA7_9GAMM|nr:hypothetical protein [Fluoribacter dumoffii]KTC88809.1 hypothetical protein Ldum_3067 [Fluoribacter dumoffii NY 23]MCW8385895.1 hypothetical protein [Fluoribacter dumoffii]MCW8418949.1 hypothetical protein [Fluoribacter dumoffii]MCW8453207.1 hypothetical protein [Fluoribacter dumoffii]MCW8459572.1 hypothetical protein [Fluoribacter dumoffii]